MECFESRGQKRGIPADAYFGGLRGPDLFHAAGAISRRIARNGSRETFTPKCNVAAAMSSASPGGGSVAGQELRRRMYQARSVASD
jgi:hypothetical protein